MRAHGAIQFKYYPKQIVLKSKSVTVLISEAVTEPTRLKRSKRIQAVVFDFSSINYAMFCKAFQEE